MKRKMLCFILIASMLLALAACENNTSGLLSNDSTSHLTESQYEPIRQSVTEAPTSDYAINCPIEPNVILPLPTSQEITETLVSYDVDLDHDGVTERLVVDLRDPEDFEEFTVAVYKMVGEKEDLIWSDVAGLHHDFKGFYLYEENNLSYLAKWRIDAACGDNNFNFEVFYLSPEGEEVIFKNYPISFSLPLGTGFVGGHYTDSFDDLLDYVKRINSYLEKSITLLDTIGGYLIYSTSDDRKVNDAYDESWIRAYVNVD